MSLAVLTAGTPTPGAAHPARRQSSYRPTSGMLCAARQWPPRCAGRWPVDCDRAATNARQSGGAIGLVASDQFVARFPTDAVPLAQRRHREQLSLIIGDELHTLVHRRPRLPGHRTSSASRWRKCYPGRRTVLLPTSPDHTGSGSRPHERSSGRRCVSHRKGKEQRGSHLFHARKPPAKRTRAETSRT